MFVLPLLAIALALLIRGRRAARMLERARQLLQRYWPQTLAWVLGVIGGVVVLLGATGLVSQGHSTLARAVGHARHFVTHP
jgi:hypothetical protein